MAVQIASRTDVGRVRNLNEDAALTDAHLGLFVVCDGMGGHNGGEIASALACDVIHQEVAGAFAQRESFEALGDAASLAEVRHMLKRAVAVANEAIFAQARRYAALAGMGTTCTAVLLAGHGKALLAHVGDSRLLLLRGGAVHQLSCDHSFVNDLLRRGAITAQQANEHTQRNVLTRALGVQLHTPIDTLAFDVDPGDTLLLCSDGVHGYFPEQHELNRYFATAELQEAVDLIIAAALERGGHDNLTAIAVRTEGPVPLLNDPHCAQFRLTMLQELALFRGLTYPELVTVAGLGQSRSFTARQWMVRQGEPCDGVWLLLTGQVQAGDAAQGPAVLAGGAWLGHAEVLQPCLWPISWRALSDSVALFVRREDLMDLIRSEPVAGCKILGNLVGLALRHAKAAALQIPDLNA